MYNTYLYRYVLYMYGVCIYNLFRLFFVFSVAGVSKEVRRAVINDK